MIQGLPSARMEQGYLTINGVAELLHVSRMSVYRWFKLGLTYHKLGRSVRIARADLGDFMMSRRRNDVGAKRNGKEEK